MKIKFSQLALVALVIALYLSPFVFTFTTSIKPSAATAAAGNNLQNLKAEIKAKIHKQPQLQSKLLNFSIKQIESSNPEMAAQLKSRVLKNDYELCPMCISLLDQTINQLVNIILNAGVLGSCSKLCGYLQGVGQLAVVACDLICSYLGVDEFINLIDKADLDAIYGCQLVSLCPVRNCKLPVCAQFFNTRVVPQSAPKGSTFTAVSQLRVYNQTGTGELYFEVDGPVTADISGGELKAEGFAAGSFEIQVTIQAQDDQQNQVEWFPGQYEFFAAACEGECGSKHPNSRILAETKALFNVTESN